MTRQSPPAEAPFPPPLGDWPREDFLGVPLDCLSTEQLVALVAERVREGGKPSLSIGYVNAANSNLAARNAEVAGFLRGAGVCYADGMGVVGARRLGLPCPERVNAGDFFPLLMRSFDRPVRLALVGGWEGLPEKAGEVFLREAPEGSALWARHGYGLDEEAARQTLAEELRAFDPGLLLLGMGAPRQEALARWLAEEACLEISVVWCVGALFEYFAGERKRAPVWARKAGLEWAVRFALEPRRLWKRYLVGNGVFVARVARASLSGKRGRSG